VHGSLSAQEILYLTLAYDWMLFSHQLSNRLAKGEEVFHFCFYVLQFIASAEFCLPLLAPRACLCCPQQSVSILPAQSEDDRKTASHVNPSTVDFEAAQVRALLEQAHSISDDSAVNSRGHLSPSVNGLSESRLLPDADIVAATSFAGADVFVQPRSEVQTVSSGLTRALASAAQCRASSVQPNEAPTQRGAAMPSSEPHVDSVAGSLRGRSIPIAIPVTSLGRRCRSDVDVPIRSSAQHTEEQLVRCNRTVFSRISSELCRMCALMVIGPSPCGKLAAGEWRYPGSVSTYPSACTESET